MLEETLYEEDLQPVCSPALLAAGSRPRGPADLRDWPLLYDLGWNGDWSYWFARQGRPTPDLSRASGFRLYSMVVQAAVGGLGIAIGRSMLIAHELERRTLVPVFDRQAEAPECCCLITTAAARQRPEVQAFREWVLREAEAAGRPAADGLPRLHVGGATDSCSAGVLSQKGGHGQVHWPDDDDEEGRFRGRARGRRDLGMLPGAAAPWRAADPWRHLPRARGPRRGRTVRRVVRRRTRATAPPESSGSYPASGADSRAAHRGGGPKGFPPPTARGASPPRRRNRRAATARPGAGPGLALGLPPAGRPPRGAGGAAVVLERRGRSRRL